jgi:hypothetical protein
MEGLKALDIVILGRESFSLYYNNIKNSKKSIKNYLTIVDSFSKITADNKKALNNLFKTIKEFSEADIPFPILKNLEILIRIYEKYNDAFLVSIETPLENLKKSILNSLKYLSNYLNFSQILSMNIKNLSRKYYENYNKLMENLGDTELAVIDEYTKSKYRLCINKLKNKEKEKDKLIKETLSNEKVYLSMKSDLSEKVDNYIEQFNSIMKKINPKIVQLNEDIKNTSLIAISTLKKNNANFMNQLENETMELLNKDNNCNNEGNEFFNFIMKKDENSEIHQAVELSKYNIKILNEEEKTSIECDTLKQKSKKLTKALFYTAQDIFNIVKNIYDLNFKMVNQDSFNLEKERNKIIITDIMGKILSYNFDTRTFVKECNITQEEINYLFSAIFTEEEYFMKYLLCLNNYRTTGKYEISPNVFNIIKIIFDKKADELLVANNIKIAGFIVILSQTFYMMKDNEKYYLQKEVQKKQYFRDIKFWVNYFEDGITEDVIKFEEESKKIGAVYSDEKKEKKLEEIAFSKMASLVTSLTDFEIEKEKIEAILLPLFDKYKISQQTRESILQLMHA